MASGLEMYDALKRAVQGLPGVSRVKINHLDKLDLSKLNRSDLLSLGFDDAMAEQVCADLLQGGVRELGKALGVELVVDPMAMNLIPGEGIRRAGEMLQDDPETLDEMLQFMDEIRHPERHAS